MMDRQFNLQKRVFVCLKKKFNTENVVLGVLYILKHRRRAECISPSVTQWEINDYPKFKGDILSHSMISKYKAVWFRVREWIPKIFWQVDGFLKVSAFKCWYIRKYGNQHSVTTKIYSLPSLDEINVSIILEPTGRPSCPMLVLKADHKRLQKIQTAVYIF